MFAVIFDVEQAGFLSRLAETRDKKKTKLAFGFDGKRNGLAHRDGGAPLPRI